VGTTGQGIWRSLVPFTNTTLHCADLTARDKSRGEAAVDALKHDGGLAEIKFHIFDVTNNASIEALAGHLKEAHEYGIDFVINNAGIAMDGFSKYLRQRSMRLLIDAL
jgi:NAD(P)-dependent dehydrogenase (short-subunit alcohol dehydrogenase family)